MLIENKLAALATMLDDGMRAGFSDLSASAAAAILTLRHRGSLTTSDLASILGVAQPTAVRLIDGLVRSGLARRGARQGRSAPLHLQSKGRRRAKRLQAARLRVAGDLLQGLGAADRRSLDRILDQLLAGGTGSRDQVRTTCRLCALDRCAGDHCPVGTRAKTLEQHPITPNRISSV